MTKKSIIKDKLSVNNKDFLFDEKYYQNGYTQVLGIDEVGRGALAGPVVSCGIMVDFKEFDFLKTLNIKDSKLLNHNQRIEIYNKILKQNIKYYCSFRDNFIIDQINILKATLDTFKDIESYFSKHKDHFTLVDGNRYFRSQDDTFELVVKGDSKSIIIGAASIIAKVTRDAIFLTEYENKYPYYGFAQHKGYATKKHITALLEFSYLEIHRKTFIKNIIPDIGEQNELFDSK